MELGILLKCSNCFFFLSCAGFGDRLLSEVKKLAPKDVKIRVGAFSWVFITYCVLFCDLCPLKKKKTHKKNHAKSVAAVWFKPVIALL